MAPEGAGECGGRCQRKKAAHAGAGAVAGFVTCLLLVWASSRAYGWSGRLADAAARAVEVGLRRTKCWGSSTSAGASCTRWPPSSHRPSRYLLICSHSDQLYVCSSCCGHSVLMVTTNGIGRMLIALQSHRFEQGSCIEACDHLWNNLMYF
jgi:hypothetical protein